MVRLGRRAWLGAESGSYSGIGKEEKESCRSGRRYCHPNRHHDDQVEEVEQEGSCRRCRTCSGCSRHPSSGTRSGRGAGEEISQEQESSSSGCNGSGSRQHPRCDTGSRRGTSKEIPQEQESGGYRVSDSSSGGSSGQHSSVVDRSNSGGTHSGRSKDSP